MSIPFERNFLPGPVGVHPEVLAALGRPMRSHRGAEVAALYARIAVPLRELVRTVRPVIVTGGSTTAMMEVAVRNGVRERLLALVSGPFGERFAQVAEQCGREVVRVSVHPGATVEPSHLRQFLDGPPVDAISVVHSETGTGSLAPLSELATVVRGQDVAVLVDAASSLGAAELDVEGWGLDFVFGGSQKCLGLPPGLAFGVASPRFVERARGIEGRGWATDVVRLVEAAAEGRPLVTPPLPLLDALDTQLARMAASGGRERRWARHAAMRARMDAWAAAQREVDLLAREGRRSPSVSVLRVRPGFARRVANAMQARGYLVATGIDDATDALVRIGHMGDHDVRTLDPMLDALASVLAECDAPHSRPPSTL